MLKTSVRKLSIGISLLALCWASVAFAAVGEIITDHPANYWTWENQVARAGLGSASGSTTGMWHFGAASGNPDTDEDDGFSFFEKVHAYVYTSDTGNEYRVGSGGTTTYSVDLRSQTGTSTWIADSARKLTVEVRLQLVRDVLKWEYRIKNTSTIYRRIGFRLFEDADYLGTFGGPYYVSGRGFFNTVQEFTGSQVPNEWGVRMSPDSFDTASIGGHALLNARQVLYGTDITRPSRLVFGKEPDIVAYSWPAILNPPDNPIITPGATYSDGASPSFGVGLYYPISYLGPGQTRVIKGQVQLSWSTVNTMQYFGLGLYAPEWIGYTEGDNPSTPETEDGYHDPDEFSVRAFLTNCTYDPTIRPSVSITIDPGQYFDLAPGEIAMKSDAHLVGLEDHDFVWRLRPRDEACGLVPVKVTAIMTPGGSVTTTAWINVAALPTRTFASGPYLMGFPFAFADSDAPMVLGSMSDNLAWYDTVSRSYLYGSSSPISLETGRGYWMNFAGPTTLTLQGATPLAQTDPQVVQLVRGWNLITNPFQYSIYWGMCRVDYDFNTYPLEEGVRRGILRQELYSYDNAAGRLRIPMNKLTDYLHPYEGYWVYVNQPTMLQFTPNPFVPAMLVQPTPPGPGPGPGPLPGPLPGPFPPPTPVP